MYRIFTVHVISFRCLGEIFIEEIWFQRLERDFQLRDMELVSTYQSWDVKFVIFHNLALFFLTITIVSMHDSGNIF